jgi:hypothetical protein
LESASASNADATTLASTGILLQGRTETGEWVTVRRHYPRQFFDECLIDTLDQGPARLVFVGRHSLRFVGRVTPVSAVSPPRAALVSARHSRLGDVRAAVAATEGATTVISPGDTLVLEYEISQVPTDRERSVFVVARGGYSSSPPLHQQREPGSVQPLRFALEPNRPNPFVQTTRIAFVLPERTSATLRIYDAQGREVRGLAGGVRDAGRHELLWDQRDDEGRLVRPGVYLYELVAGPNQARHKMVVLP